ncbi:MAG: NAD-dependent epimerase/dehydratase family protein [Candidatus Aenigmarchaeota archaeon]|nr:NAD-dependent epimerase/dehydratase family protein [Candidatus Aenigmarchaeota archaeon]
MQTNKPKALVTGSAGFIGSHLAEALEEKYAVLGIDNFSAGVLKKVPAIKKDIVSDDITPHFRGAETVFHFAANPDVKIGATNTNIHIEQNIIATHRVLEAMRKNSVKKIVFASSSTVYGNAKKIPTPEEYAPLEPVSIYGASKLACESIICAYCHTFNMQAWIFRFANVIGPRSNHGIIPDFIRKLKTNPKKLEILGNGEQNKSYLYIEDCIHAIIVGFEKSSKKINIFNVGSKTQTNVKKIAEIVADEANLAPHHVFTGGIEGWKGDVPVMMLDITKLTALGWKPKRTSNEAIKKTVTESINT